MNALYIKIFVWCTSPAKVVLHIQNQIFDDKQIPIN